MTILTGVETQSGTGSNSSFSWAHGMGETPDTCIVSPCTADTSSSVSTGAGAAIHYTWDATNIYAVYTNDAPSSGTDNVVFSWIAVKN